MDRLMIVARLKPGSRERVQALLEAGPPFDPDEPGFERHSVFLSGSEVVFLFEGAHVERVVDAIVNDPELSGRFAQWAEVVEWPPHIAHERYAWQASGSPGIGLGF